MPGLNSTDPLAQSKHGTNPQNLIEKILRQRVYASLYWKEYCFGLTSETLVDRAIELDHIGGTYAGNNKSTPFLCLVLKMLQIQPETDIVVELIKNEDYKYVRALGAMYLRLVGRYTDVYKYLEPLYNDYRKLRRRKTVGWEVIRMDMFIDELLHEGYSCEVAMPRIPSRITLEDRDELPKRESALGAVDIDAELAKFQLADSSPNADTTSTAPTDVANEKGEVRVVTGEPDSSHTAESRTACQSREKSTQAQDQAPDKDKTTTVNDEKPEKRLRPPRETSKGSDSLHRRRDHRSRRSRSRGRHSRHSRSRSRERHRRRRSHGARRSDSDYSRSRSRSRDRRYRSRRRSRGGSRSRSRSRDRRYRSRGRGHGHGQDRGRRRSSRSRSYSSGSRSSSSGSSSRSTSHSRSRSPRRRSRSRSHGRKHDRPDPQKRRDGTLSSSSSTSSSRATSDTQPRTATTTSTTATSKVDAPPVLTSSSSSSRKSTALNAILRGKAKKDKSKKKDKKREKKAKKRDKKSKNSESSAEGSSAAVEKFSVEYWNIERAKLGMSRLRP